MCVGCVHSPESLTRVSSSGFPLLPPSCNSNYLGYRLIRLQTAFSSAIADERHSAEYSYS
ncbi:hypothetical protein EG335_17655 [Pectobacterium versatile]|nr:hypothetical protein DF215_01880 [Pectobacterium versatile]TAI94477.1 hypothetical protein EG335_17655 [Pectobacterium versatile]